MNGKRRHMARQSGEKQTSRKQWRGALKQTWPVKRRQANGKWQCKNEIVKRRNQMAACAVRMASRKQIKPCGANGIKSNGVPNGAALNGSN